MTERESVIEKMKRLLRGGRTMARTGIPREKRKKEE
jgi:hypothetical protein